MGVSPLIHTCDFQEAPGAEWFSPISGATSNNYSLTTTTSTAPGAWQFELQVTDSNFTTVTSVPQIVTVNTQLAAPTVTPTPGTVNLGQSSTLTSTIVTTGTSPYTYQSVPRGTQGTLFSAISGATSASYNFVTNTSTATGGWQFKMQVTDSSPGGQETNTSSVITVTVTSLPGVPVLISITPNPSTTGQISLNWTVVVGVTSYKVYRVASNFTDVTGLAPIATPSINQYADSVTTSGTYWYAVVASKCIG